MGNCIGGEKNVAGNNNNVNKSASGGGKDEIIETQGSVLPPVDTSLALTNSVLGGSHAQDVSEVYDVGKVLGAGQFGTTRLAVHKTTGKRFAIKSINKARLAGMEDIACVKRELQVMHHVSGHPAVVSLKEAFEDHVYVHLVMELCEGGDMVDSIIKRGKYTERDAATSVRTMLKVVAYCHELGVAHRDLKPDNFLLTDDSPDAEIKVTDFGLSTFVAPGEQLNDICGTSYYVAPEILFRKYDKRADVWAVGVIAYILLSGRPPFAAVSDEDVFRQIVDNGKPDFSNYVWDNISTPAKDAIQRMMTYDYKDRPTAREMLEHEWVREDGVATDNELQPEVLQRMRSFAAMNRLKKQALLFIGQQLSPDEITGLKEMFTALDKDGNGTLTLEELRQGLESSDVRVPKEELIMMLESADCDGNQELDYEEFVAATMHVCKLQQEEHLIAAFKHFDLDNDGFITRDELETALKQAVSGDMAALGNDVTRVLLETDTDGDGRINYAEFCRLMLPEQGDSSHSAAARFAASYGQQSKKHKGPCDTDAASVDQV